MLTDNVKEYIEKSVLCWLATSSLSNIPNVSPKEIFCSWRDDHLLIANIASPKSVKNILANKQVCISFVDVFIQKGFKLKGEAIIISRQSDDFQEHVLPLKKMVGDSYQILSIIKIKITSVKPILAPSYLMFPKTTEEDQIESAKKRYGLNIKNELL